jgi:hypothetical protein
MRKFLTSVCLSLFLGTGAMAMQVPQSVQDFVNKEFPETNFRFDHPKFSKVS